jgi:hypothetical protein
MPPKIIFIVPYRDREPHKYFFDRYMPYILEDYNEDDYEIIFSHQNNKLPFNRGAMKNLGFLYAKNKYPETYKDITFVFNDIDSLPYRKGLLDFQTTKGIIKHFYGYKFGLGGIFSIVGSDFEKSNGFPNFWGWGFEDNEIQRRTLAHGLKIDRSVFFTVNSMEILHFYDETVKQITRSQMEHEVGSHSNDGIKSLHEIYSTWNEETNMLDNTGFKCLLNHDDDIISHDIRNGNKIKYNKNALKKNKESKNSKVKRTKTANDKMYTFVYKK